MLGGAGQIRLGQTRKGLFIIGIAVLGLVAFVVPGVIIICVGAYDAYVIGTRLDTVGSVEPWEWFWQPAASAIWKVVRVEPLGITESFLGTETLRIDNREGRRAITRSLSIEKEWVQEYVIEHERAQTTTSQFEPAVTKSTMVKRTVENLCREKHSYSESRKQVLREQVAVEVPPHSSVLVELRWKHILDGWTLVLANGLGDEARVPTHVVTKLSFDQRIVDAG